MHYGDCGTKILEVGKIRLILRSLLARGDVIGSFPKLAEPAVWTIV